MRNARSRWVAVLAVAAYVAIAAAEATGANLLDDPGFEAGATGRIGDEKGPRQWRSASGAVVVTEQGRDASRSVHLQNGASVAQRIPAQPKGVFELTLWARGQGIVALSDGYAKREMALGQDWSLYRFAFEAQTAGEVEITISAAGPDAEAWVDDLSLTEADAELAEAWRKQQEALVQFGFVPGHLSAQRPAPTVAGTPAAVAPRPLPAAATERVIFADERYDAVWVEDPEDVIEFFAKRGFRKLTADEIGAWMTAKVEAHDAYGTVCIFPSGMLPDSVLGAESLKATEKGWGDKAYYRRALVRQYMEAGGRVVWMGNKTLYSHQGPEGAWKPFPRGRGDELLADLGTEQRIYYGARGDGPLVLTAAGKAWGLSKTYAPVRPVNLQDVTISFLEKPGDKASQIFLKTLNPACPLSGLLSFPHYVKGASDVRVLEDVYRLSLFFGTKVDVPLPPKDETVQPDLEMALTLGGAGKPRTAFLRGERVPVHVEVTNRIELLGGVLNWAFTQGGRACTEGSRSVGLPAGTTPLAALELETATLGVGDYDLDLTLSIADREPLRASTPLYLRRVSSNPFFLGVWGNPPTNRFRQQGYIEDLMAHNMELVCGPTFADLALRHGLRFLQRIEGPEGFPTGVNAEKESADVVLLQEDGKPKANPWTPSLVVSGLAHPRIVSGRMHGTAEQIAANAACPNLFPYILTNDDFSVYYRCDWSPYVLELFRQRTGRTVSPPQYGKNGLVDKPKGVVPDDDPWLLFKEFIAGDVIGYYNRMNTRGKDQGLPHGRLGPVPGNMQIPLWTQGQYPPLQFGENGFDLLSYYYYNGYWVPLLGNLWNDEIARLGNRNLPLWTTPDIYCGGDEPSYSRQTFFLHLAGGVSGLNYYSYSSRLASAWAEVGRLSTVIRELGPLLAALKPAQKRVGLFMPFAHWACDWLYPTLGVYPFANLLSAHIDVEPVCREELLAGRGVQYDAILAWNADWVSASAAQALQACSRRGTKVILDAACAVDIPGASRLEFDLAMGNGKPSASDAADARFGRPGIRDYHFPDRIDLVRQSIGAIVPPLYDSPSDELIIRAFEADGVTYLWLVNIHTREEYEYLRARAGAGVKVVDPEKALAEMRTFLRGRGVYDKPFETTLTLPDGEFVICDVLTRRELPKTAAGDGSALCGVSMERLGGTLLALYPARVETVELNVYPGHGRRQHTRIIEVRIRDTRGRLLPGLLPAHIEVLFPDGTVAPYGGYVAIRNGRYMFDIEPAENEPRGEWTVKVTELAFGTEGETELTHQ